MIKCSKSNSDNLNPLLTCNKKQPNLHRFYNFFFSTSSKFERLSFEKCLLLWKII